MILHYVFFLRRQRPPRSTRTDTLFPYTTLFRAQPFATKRLRSDDRSDHRSVDIEIADGCQTLHACSRPGDAAVKPHSQAHSLCVHSLDGFDQRPGLPHCHMDGRTEPFIRSEEHPSELQSLMRLSYAFFCFQKKTNITSNN